MALIKLSSVEEAVRCLVVSCSARMLFQQLLPTNPKIYLKNCSFCSKIRVNLRSNDFTYLQQAIA